MAQWKPGEEVWAARWGYPMPKIDVLSVRVQTAGPKEARLEKMHEALNYRTRISHDEGARSKLEALLILKAETVAELDAARSAALAAENKIAAVESALAGVGDGE
jgi:outer membrane murein-binding lipoprotein Lpp